MDASPWQCSWCSSMSSFNILKGELQVLNPLHSKTLEFMQSLLCCPGDVMRECFHPLPLQPWPRSPRHVQVRPYFKKIGSIFHLQTTNSLLYLKRSLELGGKENIKIKHLLQKCKP